MPLFLCLAAGFFSTGLLPNNTKEIMSFEYELCLLINKLQPKATFDFKVTQDSHSSVTSIFSYSSLHIFFSIFYLFFSLNGFSSDSSVHQQVKL